MTHSLDVCCLGKSARYTSSKESKAGKEANKRVGETFGKDLAKGLL